MKGDAAPARAPRSTSMRANILTAMTLAALLIGGAVESFAQGRPAAGVSIRPQADLAFGSLIAGPGGGSVTVAPDGIRTSLGGVYALPSSGAAAARFLVEATLPKKYMIVLPTNATLDGDRGGQMVLDNFVSTPSGRGQVSMPTKSEELLVGATLHVAGGQQPGTYRGSFYVTVTLFD